MNSPKGPQERALVARWESVAKSYDEASYWAKPETHAWLHTLLSHIGEPANKDIIEVGCGSGFLSLALAKAGARVALLDITPKALAKAAETFVRAGLERPRCFQTDALNSGIPDESFDIVWNNGVVEHFTDEGKARLICEMRRMTRPGGTTILFVPNRCCWPFQVAQTFMKWRRTWPYGFEDDMSPGRLRRFCHRLGLDNVAVYAFDPWLGWYWLPCLGPFLKRCFAPRTVESHLRRSPFGWLSVLVIPKELSDVTAGTDTLCRAA